MQVNRRLDSRVSLEMYLNTYVADRPYRAVTVNVSEHGLYLNSLSRTPLPAGTPVGVELTLPGDTIWAAGQLCFDEMDRYFYGTGVRFVAMARRHARMLHEFLDLRRA
jgi:hypothetical protein